MGVLTRCINWKDKELGLVKPYTSKYDINTVKYDINTVESNGTEIDIRKSLWSKLQASRQEHSKLSSWLSSSSNTLFTGQNSEGMGRFSDKFLDLEISSALRSASEIEFDLERKIDDFQEFAINPELDSISDWYGLEPETFDFDRVFCVFSNCYYINDFCIPKQIDWYVEFIAKLEDIAKAKKLLKILSTRINFLLGLIKKRLRNLRQIFTKLHSFHFKNLDDYHSTALTSNLVG